MEFAKALKKIIIIIIDKYNLENEIFADNDFSKTLMMLRGILVFECWFLTQCDAEGFLLHKYIDLEKTKPLFQQ